MTPTLYPYQIFGADFLASREQAGLFDDPGLGKSGQACCAWKKVKAKTVVVVCPAVVRSVWRHEVVKWDAGDPVVCMTTDDVTSGKINIVSYEGASATWKYRKQANGKKVKIGLDLEHKNSTLFVALTALKPDLVVFDEGHFLKSDASLRTRSCFGMGKPNSLVEASKRAWVLTGTPMPNNPAELWPMLVSMFPDAIARRDGTPLPYWQFVNKFCKTFDNGFGTQIIGGKNLGELRERLMERCLRRKASKVLKDLPAIRYAMLPVDGDLSGLDNEDAKEIAAALAMPDPIAGLKKIGTHVASLRRYTGMAKVDSVIKWCVDNIDNYGKIVVFAHHKDVIAKLANGLDHSVQISGSTSASDREKAINDFQEGDAKFFIGQIQAAGTGLTLTAANVMVFAEYSWVPAENQQASKRIHRIGQLDSCLVYFATVEGSVDEDIMKAVRNKMETIKELGL